MSLADFLLNNLPLPSLPSYLTHYEPGLTPLSTRTSVAAALVGYLVIIFSLREVMRSHQALKMTALFQLHNMLLSSGSLVLLVLMVEEISPIVLQRGMFYGICGKDAWTPVRVIYRFLPA
jgi:fatty acid elongase 3